MWGSESTGAHAKVWRIESYTLLMAPTIVLHEKRLRDSVEHDK